MTEPEVIIVPTGTANIASVLSGLEKAGAKGRVSQSVKDIERAQKLVLPGVGTMKAAMERLKTLGLVDILKNRFLDNRPTLTLCLGLQLMCEESDESPDSKGFGVVPCQVTRFGGDLKVPHFGWNLIKADKSAKILKDGYYYFANSYRITTPPPGWSFSTTFYGDNFVSALERGSVLACQFHPELSGQNGIDLIKRWLSSAAGGL